VIILFDLDGTLVDSVPDIAWSLNATLGEAGFERLSLDEVRMRVGDGAGQLLASALPKDVATGTAESLLPRFLKHYEGHLSVDTMIYPGIVDLLNEQRAAGRALAVLTNKPAALARSLLTDLKLAPYFVAIVGDGDGFPRKPSPDAGRELILRNARSFSDALVVGDGLPDVRMARAIPCRSIAALWGYSSESALRAEGPSHIARSVSELATLLSSAELATNGS